MDRAGVVGADGETHQGLFDLSFLSTIPNINILAPKNFFELEKMLEFGIKLNKPVFIRYPRGAESEVPFDKTEDIMLGQAEVIQEGKDITIVSIGKMVARAKEVADLLKGRDIDCEIINARFLKPIDKETILKSVQKTKRVVTIEDNLLKAGLGDAVISLINESNINDVKVKTFGYNDIFVKHGKVEDLEKLYGLDAKRISEYIESAFHRKTDCSV